MEINRGAVASRNGYRKEGAQSPLKRQKHSRNPEPKNAVKRGWVCIRRGTEVQGAGMSQRLKEVMQSGVFGGFHRKHWDLELRL